MKFDLAEYLPRNAAGRSATWNPHWRQPRALVWGVGALLLTLFLLIAIFPTLISRWYLETGARLLDTGGDIAQAARLFERARDWSPSDPEIDRALARAYVRLEQPQEAIEALERAYRHQPESLLIRQELAQAYEADGQMQRADALWSSLALSGREMLAQGEQARKAGRLAEALAWYNRATRAQPELSSSIEYFRAVVLYDQGQRESAFQALEGATRSDQGWLSSRIRFQAWHTWGTWLYELHRVAEAETAFEQAVKIAPDDQQLRPLLSESYRFLGLTQWDQGQLDQALVSLEKAVALNTRSPWAHIHYGKVLYLQNHAHASATEAQFSAALKLYPENAMIWKNVYDFWRWVGEARHAESLCARAHAAGLSAVLSQECQTP